MCVFVPGKHAARRRECVYSRAFVAIWFSLNGFVLSSRTHTHTHAYARHHRLHNATTTQHYKTHYSTTERQTVQQALPLLYIKHMRIMLCAHALAAVPRSIQQHSSSSPSDARMTIFTRALTHRRGSRSWCTRSHTALESRSDHNNALPHTARRGPVAFDDDLHIVKTDVRKSRAAVSRRPRVARACVRVCVVQNPEVVHATREHRACALLHTRAHRTRTHSQT